MRTAFTAGPSPCGACIGTRPHFNYWSGARQQGTRQRYSLGRRQWQTVTTMAANTRRCFYDSRKIAIMPMAFCYPGKGKSGDLPPRPECAPQWHAQLLQHMPNIQLTLLIGQYAQQYYLNDIGSVDRSGQADSFLKKYQTLTERVRHWRDAPAGFIPLPYPSPRNQIWLKKNSWFEDEVVPHIRAEVQRLLHPEPAQGSDCV